MDQQEHLVNLLRSVVRMFRYRGFDINPNDKHLLELDKPEVSQDFIKKNYTIGTEGFNEKIRSNPIVNYLSSNKLLDGGYRRMMSDFFVKPDGECGLVYFSPYTDLDKQTGKNDMIPFVQLMEKYSEVCKSGVIITAKGLSPPASKDFEILKQSFKVHHFTDSEVMFNPLDHVYTGDVRIMTPSEKEEFIKSNELSIKSLPTVNSNEPTMRYLGGVAGDIVEYDSEDFLPNQLVNVKRSYRLVVNSMTKVKPLKVKKT